MCITFEPLDTLEYYDYCFAMLPQFILLQAVLK